MVGICQLLYVELSSILYCQSNKTNYSIDEPDTYKDAFALTLTSFTLNANETILSA